MLLKRGRAVRGLLALIVALIVALVWGRANVSREKPSAVMTAEVAGLVESNLGLADDIIADFEQRLVTDENTPWEMFHGLLARGRDYDIHLAQSEQPQRCLEWLLQNAASRSFHGVGSLTVDTEQGPTFREVGNRKVLQDHVGQFLYILSECDVDPASLTVDVPDRGSVNLTEFVRTVERNCHEFDDHSWALPMLQRWGQARWENRFGETFDTNRLLQAHLEREQPACFSTHWCGGLALAVANADARIDRRTRQEAEQRIAMLIDRARAAQEGSGQFGVAWLQSEFADFSPSSVQLISHQGHMLEWLAVALSDQQLAAEEWYHRGMWCLLHQLRHHGPELEYGRYAHCIRAVSLYRRRMNAALPAYTLSGRTAERTSAGDFVVR